MSAPFVSSRWYPVVFVFLLAMLVGGTTLVLRSAIGRLLHEDAVTTGRNWTDYLAANLTDLDRIATGEAPSSKDRAFLDQVREVGQVFLYKIYDSAGRVRFVSGDIPEGDEDDRKGLTAHNATAAAAVARGRPEVEAKEGTPPQRPAYYAETYVPVIKAGKVVAVVETYVDQTEKREQFHAALLAATIALGVLIAAAFAIPALAWLLRDRDNYRAEQRARYLAEHDALTGLANRARLAEALIQMLAALPERHQHVAVHCLDLDNFKDVNDALGHDAGDTLIKVVAGRLRSIAHPDDIVARLGADEFAIIQADPGDRMAAEGFARRAADLIAEPILLGENEMRITACFGIAMAPEHGVDARRLLRSADLALAKAKATGRSQLRFFAPLLDVELFQRLTLERAISVALEEDRFLLYFQPQFDGAARNLVGFEALLRLPTEEGGFIPPAMFIPAAESMGLIRQIGAWVIEHACAVAATWPEPLKVAVNLSPAQFVGDIHEVVAAALKKSGLAPERLEIEITENLLIHETGKVAGVLSRIKALGASIVMDDFGTGYSSLSYLWRFPFDKIKVDRSFIKALSVGDQAAEKIIRTIVSLGRSLNMRVNVEGVESAANLEFLKRLDCDEMQGFYLGRPTPETEVAAMIMADYRSRMNQDDDRAASLPTAS